MLAIRRKVLEDLLSHPDWERRLEKCRAGREVERVLTAFCKSKGYTVKTV